jgi:hypothetical protein
MGESVRVAAMLERGEATGIARTMLTAHAAADLAEAFEAAWRSVESKNVDSTAPDSAAQAMTRLRSASRDVALPPSLPLLPQGAESLPPENRILLALALGLAAVPQVVRSPQFAARVHRWVREECSAGTPDRPLGDALNGASLETEIPARTSPSDTVALRKPNGVKQVESPPDQAREFAKWFWNQPAGHHNAARPASAAAQPAGLELPASQHPEAPELPAGEGPISSPLQARQEGIRTRLGGALYLIAAFERLGIPECFEPAWRFSNHLSRWAFLELVTRGLVSAAGRTESHRDDAIWAALAGIDGREPGLPAFQNFPSRDRFRIPQLWASELHLEPEEIAWASRQRRIAVWSRAGWILADRRLVKGERLDDAINTEIPLRSRSAVSGAEQLRWAESPHARLGGELQIAPALKLWLECMLPALRVWLGRAMGLDRPGYAELAEALLFVPGQLFITSTRVDFSAPIDQSRIPVRRAALDLDPGWLPAWGRSIRFHYGDDYGGFR